MLKSVENNEQIAKWKNEEMARHHLEPKPTSTGIHFLTFKEALAKDLDVLYIPGFTDRHYPSPIQEHPFYSTEMLLDHHMREILEGPTYRLALEKNWLKQAVNRSSKQVVFTYPKIIWDGKEQFPSRLLGGKEEFAETSDKDENRAPKENDSSSPSRDFPRKKINQFSISALETYQKCPYQYYAYYHLKIGEKETEDLDVPADVKGNFVHQVMQKLFERELNLYEEAIDYDLYINKLIEKAGGIIEEQQSKDAFLAKAHESIRKSFCERVLSVIGAVLKEEIELIREKKKNSLPRYFEWAFGKKNISPLRIKEGGREIFISGRIDRIDINEEDKTYTVIDYKTGELPSGTKLKQGESLQIPLYLMATQSLLLKDYRPSAGLFIGFKDLTKKSGLIVCGGGEDKLLKKNYHISEDEWKVLQQNIVVKVFEIAQAINAGNFSPNPQSTSLCRFCDYRDICHYEAKDDLD